ncbi:glycosyltransferase family 2 protein [Larkinella sp. C7]|uniref:glycosyltransferase family 2 protein n=1 Tax=Larkinella sp. C7 TaxID=2576607 RepID=UPI0011111FC6|nr:glycosyltransferase family 2 protein [Larkinella sp. C7]
MNYQPEDCFIGSPKRGIRLLEAVTVCVNYADILAHTLPSMLLAVDRLVVVTDTRDEATARLCEAYDVEFVRTDAFYDDGATFNKARGINAGLARLSQSDWVLHIDSDIYLPPRTRMILNSIYLDPFGIHGVDRMNCFGLRNWIRYISAPPSMHQGYYLVHANVFPMGSRVCHYNADGYFPIGFFQLWNPRRSGIIRYPENWVGADHTDVVFSKSFPIESRRLIPDFYVIHLDSQKAEMGVNWMGRKTRPFTIDEKPC